MKLKRSLSLALIPLALLQYTCNADTVRTYFGTNKSEGIYTATFDTETGQLSPITLAAKITAPGFLTIAPKQDTLYATNAAFEKPNTGGVSSFKIEPDGHLTLINQQPTQGRGACHLSVDTTRQSLVAANYSSGNVAAFHIRKDGSLAPSNSTHQHDGSGSHVKRQKAPHPHSAYIHPNNAFAYVPDLGIDQVVIYSLASSEGTLTPAGHAVVPGGSQGPRHMKFSADGKHAYVLNELSLSLATYSVNSKSGQLTHRGTTSVFTPDNQQALDTMTCAEIRIHPNGKWIYTSTRDLNGEGRDTLSTFERSNDGSVTLIANTPASVYFPRNFNIDPTGKWLIAAGQRSSTLAIFSIDSATGALTLKQADIPFPGQPICIEFTH